MLITIKSRSQRLSLTATAEGGVARGEVYGGRTYWDWDDALERWIERGTGLRWQQTAPCRGLGA